MTRPTNDPARDARRRRRHALAIWLLLGASVVPLILARRYAPDLVMASAVLSTLLGGAAIYLIFTWPYETHAAPSDDAAREE